MGTLLDQTLFPSPFKLSRIPPRMLKEIPALIHPKAALHLPSKRNYTLKAQGRGFGVAVPKNNKKKPVINESKVDEDDEISQEVFDRMIRRVLFYVFAPMASGLALLYVLSMLKERGLCVVPSWLPLTTVLISFGTSGLGIGFGTLSTSWDPEVEGSVLGFEEAKKNWPVLWKEDKKSDSEI